MGSGVHGQQITMVKQGRECKHYYYYPANLTKARFVSIIKT
jgi:hypothetical protein